MGKIVFAGIVALVVASTVVAQTPSNSAKPAGNIARGKYLVNNFGMCGDCHTPMDNNGNPIKSRHLQGAPLRFRPTVEIPTWMPVAPGIAGLNWTDEQAIEFFMTGRRPDGTMAAPPMPPFRMNRADAAAVTAYLKSVKP